MKQNIFGANIARFRGKAGLTQAALAELLGVSAQAISKWETGGGYPDVETIPLIADQLNTTTDALFGIDEKQSDEHLFDPKKWKTEIIDAVTGEIEGLLSELQSTVQEAVEEALADLGGVCYYANSAEKHVNFIECLPLRVDGSARGKRNPVRIRSLFRKLYAHECLHRAERRPLYVEYEKVDAGTPGKKRPIVCEPEDLVALTRISAI
mgnify:CR=1 FL=1